ncbi:hypothetical protein JCM8547_005163 [Rhodosporidiobolus lusitaniae]
MSCSSPTCARCGYPTLAPPAIVALELSLLSFALSILRSFPPFPPKSPHLKTHKTALKSTQSLLKTAQKRHLLPCWTAAKAFSFLQALERDVFPLLDMRHDAVVAEYERWEALMPRLIAEEKDREGRKANIEVWERKRKGWIEELGRISEVSEKWEELAPWLRVVAGRGMKEEEAEMEEEKAGASFHGSAGASHVASPQQSERW